MSKPHVAVVAVHGIADQVPAASAREVGELLHHFTDDPKYSLFQEKPLPVPTAPLVTEETLPRSAKHALAERSGYVQSQLDGTAKSAPAAGMRSPDHEFMRSQIADYERKNPPEPYQTLRLEAERTSGGKSGAVHVYEMYWADLSRVGKGFFQILGDLYQLIFHIPHLGRQALELACLEKVDSKAGNLWRWGTWLYNIAQRILTLVMPLLALLILVTLLTLLPLGLPPRAKLYLAAGCLALAATAALGFMVFLLRPPHKLGMFSGALPLLAIPLVGWQAFRYLSEIDPSSSALGQILSISWLLIGLAAFRWILGKLRRYRPGARRLGIGLGLLFAIPLLGLVLAGASRETLFSGILWVAEAELFALNLFFLLFALTGVLAALCTWVAARMMAKGLVRQRFRGAAWTARATLACAITFYALASVSIAAAVYNVSSSMLPEETHIPLKNKVTGAGSDSALRIPEFVREYLETAATDGFPIMIVGLLALVVVLLWTLAPLLLHEARPDDARRARQGERAERLGRWLDGGLFGIPAAINLLFLLSVLVAPAMTAYSFVSDSEPALDAGKLIFWLGAMIAASAVGLLALRSRLVPLLGSLRSSLDRALDVDNYLREHPRNNTPRARIAERYSSLLRYLADWRCPEDREPYRAIVIVAHSQGTAITADLLRFLHYETQAGLEGLMNADPAVRETGLYLVTMGSPLAQAYGRAFPHLYHWMNGEPAAWTERIGPSAPAFALDKDGNRVETQAASRNDSGHAVTHTLAGDPAPDPRYLALDRWVNVYRSGDYVGRSFWRRLEDYPELYQAKRKSDTKKDVHYSVSEDPARLRRELCIGSGAHVRYWDPTAGAVAREIDLLIAEALGGRPGSPPSAQGP